MGELVPADDGLPAEGNVGPWVEDKYHALREYLKYHAKARAKFEHRAYVEVFCGPGCIQLRETGQFIDGSPVRAWKCSVEDNAPFSALYIADSDKARRQACAQRLRKLGAPVHEVEGDALTAAAAIVAQVDPYGLHFSFVDPYSLGELRLELLRILAGVKRMDIMVHISAMDLFRNFDRNLAGAQREFETFAPNWKQHVPKGLSKDEQRRAVVEYWKKLVDAMGLDAQAEMKAVKNSVNRDLYWLLVLTHHKLGAKFWKIVLDSDPQRRLI